jgi:iron complex transport system permease protein
VLALTLGAASVPLTAVIGILLDALGLPAPWPFEDQHRIIVLSIRLPRAILSCAVGGTLAVAGATMQGLFRNPLADPGLIGVSGGAALAAAMVIVLGDLRVFAFMKTLGPFTLSVAAFAGGLMVTAMIYRIARRGNLTSVSTMLLAGIAINAGAVAGIGMLSYASTDQQLRDLTFWMMGSVGGATWTSIGPVLPIMLVAILALPRFANQLNALLLGEREAFHLGIDVERLKKMCVVLVALGVGAAVSISGIIAFLGLIVPHLVRLAVGPDHRLLLPSSVLLGAALLSVGDLVARSVAAPAEIPIGIVTSLIGAPFFLGLLLRQRVEGT